MAFVLKLEMAMRLMLVHDPWVPRMLNFKPKNLDNMLMYLSVKDLCDGGG